MDRNKDLNKYMDLDMDMDFGMDMDMDKDSDTDIQRFWCQISDIGF